MIKLIVLCLFHLCFYQPLDIHEYVLSYRQDGFVYTLTIKGFIQDDLYLSLNDMYQLFYIIDSYTYVYMYKDQMIYHYQNQEYVIYKNYIKLSSVTYPVDILYDKKNIYLDQKSIEKLFFAYSKKIIQNENVIIVENI